MRFRNIGFATTSSYSGMYSNTEVDFRIRTGIWTLPPPPPPVTLFTSTGTFSAGGTMVTGRNYHMAAGNASVSKIGRAHV